MNDGRQENERQERFSGEPLADGMSIAASAPPRKIASRHPWVQVLVIIMGVIVSVTAISSTVSSAFGHVTGTQSIAIGMNSNPFIAYEPAPREQRLSSVEGIETIQLDIGAGSLEVLFGATASGPGSSDAPGNASPRPAGVSVQLNEHGGGQPWHIERRGTTLLVWGGTRDAKLTLPEQLRGTDVQVNLSAGILDMTGDFGAFEGTVATGLMEMRGNAESLSMTMQAGEVTYSGNVAGAARFQIGVGSLDARLLGKQPSSVDIGVDVGEAHVRLPAGSYRLDRTVGAGTFDSALREDASSKHTVNVRVMTGDVTLDQS